MKKHSSVLALGIMVITMMAACSSNPKVTQLDTSSAADYTGDWNNNDVQKVCTELINSFLEESLVAEQIAAMGRIPVVLVNTFGNDTMEHLSTEIISDNMEIAMTRSRKVKFVAGGKTRDLIRAEQSDQAGYASEDTAASIGNETGADFLMTGSVKVEQQRAGNITQKTYTVSAQLNSIETRELLWKDMSQITKEIKRSSAKF
jgi:uncharacterized protein (TIGR02722 family)